MKHGFIKVAAAAPEIRVADPMFNADAVIRAMDEHARLGVKVLVFPELTLTGATCGDLFYQNTLLAGAAAALEKVVQASEGKDMLVFVGLPVAQGAKVYDAAAAVCNGELLGVVPASCPGDRNASASDPIKSSSIVSPACVILRSLPSTRSQASCPADR